MTTLDFVIRLLAAIIFGFLIGTERQVTGHTAGIRTNVLVCLSACMFVLFPSIIGSDQVVRNSAQVITGVGFLGSGIIFKEGTNVRGINTAATIWCTAAIGVITSSGNIKFAAIATLCLILSNILLKPLSYKINPTYRFSEDSDEYRISITCNDNIEFSIRGIIMNQTKNSAFSLVELESEDIAEDRVKIHANFVSRHRRDDIAESLVTTLSLEEGVFNAGWEVMD